MDHEIEKSEQPSCPWSLSLQEYDFSIVHRSGTQNRNADGLSRNAVTPPSPDDVAFEIASIDELPELSKGNFTREQYEDDKLGPIVRLLSGTKPDDPQEFRSIKAASSKYLLQNGLLYLRGPRIGRKNAWKHRVCAPASLIPPFSMNTIPLR